jgi:hypothetical protein
MVREKETSTDLEFPDPFAEADKKSRKGDEVPELALGVVVVSYGLVVGTNTITISRIPNASAFFIMQPL